MREVSSDPASAGLGSWFPPLPSNLHLWSGERPLFYHPWPNIKAFISRDDRARRAAATHPQGREPPYSGALVWKQIGVEGPIPSLRSCVIQWERLPLESSLGWMWGGAFKECMSPPLEGLSTFLPFHLQWPIRVRGEGLTHTLLQPQIMLKKRHQCVKSTEGTIGWWLIFSLRLRIHTPVQSREETGFKNMLVPPPINYLTLEQLLPLASVKKRE